jgi:protein disulfide-isomerase A6
MLSFEVETHWYVCSPRGLLSFTAAGKLKSEPLQRHINAYAAGKKCAAQVVLDSSTNFSKMKVAQLKALVTAKGIDCSACFEKGDYVAALKGWLEQQQGADAASSEKPRVDEL